MSAKGKVVSVIYKPGTLVSLQGRHWIVRITGYQESDLDKLRTMPLRYLLLAFMKLEQGKEGIVEGYLVTLDKCRRAALLFHVQSGEFEMKPSSVGASEVVSDLKQKSTNFEEYGEIFDLIRVRRDGDGSHRHRRKQRNGKDEKKHLLKSKVKGDNGKENQMHEEHALLTQEKGQHQQQLQQEKGQHQEDVDMVSALICQFGLGGDAPPIVRCFWPELDTLSIPFTQSSFISDCL